MARLPSCVARLTLAASILVGAGAYPSKVLCGDDLEAGESMMGKTTQDSTSRTVGFKKDGSAVSCGGEYEAGGAYTAYISSTGGRRLFHLEGGSFSSGSCSNKRNDDNNAALTAPTDGSDMVLHAGWANGYGTVYITEKCTLTAPTTVAPTRRPTDACADSTTWFYKKKENTCEAYVAKKTKNCKKKDDSKVKAEDACAATCETCDDVPAACADSTTWYYKKAKKNCEYVAKDPDDRCSEKDDFKVKAKDACPVACDKCES